MMTAREGKLRDPERSHDKSGIKNILYVKRPERAGRMCGGLVKYAVVENSSGHGGRCRRKVKENARAVDEQNWTIP